MAEVWAARCEQCTFERRGRFEYVCEDAKDHERENQGHSVKVVSEWKSF